MIIPTLEGLTLAKGHAGGADLIFVPDIAGQRSISDEEVAAILDRQRGIGAGGLLRVVESAHIETDHTGQWFADLRPRRPLLPSELVLYAHYLRLSGLAEFGDGDSITIASPDGSAQVTRTGSRYSIAYPYGVPGGAEAREQGYDTAVTIGGVDGMRGGLKVDCGVPHVVVALGHHVEASEAHLAEVACDPATTAIPVLVVPDGETTLTDVDGIERPVSTFSMFSRGDEVLATIAGAVALREWSGPTGPSIFRSGEIEVRVFGDDVEVSLPAEIVAEFQLAGIAGEA